MNEEDQSKGKTSTNPPEKRNPFLSLIVVMMGLASAAWLFLPIPDLTDVLPVLGNIDEAAATAIIISCFAYFGVDIGAFFGRFTGGNKKEEREAKGEVIDR
jgi:hypothetical protein